jgi:hypothetical protein
MSQQTVVKITQDSPTQQTITVISQQQAPTQQQEQQKHTRQSFVKRNKEFYAKIFARRPALFKIGDKVKIDFDYGRLGAKSKPMKGKIIAIPKDGTLISDGGKDKPNIKWIKNNKNIQKSVETFEDQPGTGSVWYFTYSDDPYRHKRTHRMKDAPPAYRKYFVLLENGVTSLIEESDIKRDGLFSGLFS